ncbi:MAG: enoyl-CoA hydratase/isomerase family protein [Polyangiales bacterium]
MSDLKLCIDDGIARIVFDRPNVLNALSPSLLNVLIETCGDLARDDSTRVVLLEGAGGCFSAGADLPAFLSSLAGSDPHATADLGRRATLAIAALPQITVAGICGHCVGGGLVLAGACDIRIAADDARFSIPELDAGIPLGWGGMEHLIRLVGETLAADLILSCRPIAADEALRAGLISRIVPADLLGDELAALAMAIARKPLSVLRVTKRQLVAIRTGTFDARDDADTLVSTLRDPEALEAGRQYLAKRIRKR